MLLIILSVDTSTSAGSIVLAEDEKILGEINADSAETHSVRLLNGIDCLLKSLDLHCCDVDAFAVISGPGSFTGVRIGLTIIKGLAETSGKPTIPLTAFEAWVEKFPLEQGVIVPLLDARRGEVYATVFERGDGGLQALSDGMVDKPSQILGLLDHDEVLFIGDGAMRYRQMISDCRRPLWSVASSDAFLGRPMARLAHQKGIKNEFTSALDLKAYYLRKSDAELYWKEK
jgi:tRNA threonylcarbamoyladenosine biosynthesis protein TsaB